MLISYGVSSLRRRHDNALLAQEFSGEILQESETALPAPEFSPRPTELTTPPPALLDTYRNLSGEPIDKMERLYQRNQDLIGWLYIRGVVDLPVVYRDNDYYLTHTFGKKRDKGGALFLDEDHPLTEESQNLVIHGHNMYDGSMFGILGSYIHPSAVKSGAFASFTTMYAQEEYVIFAVLRVTPDPASEGYFNYLGRPVFQDEDDFYRYIGEVKDRSIIGIPVDVQPMDSILTLATCVDDDRLVVFFRRIREGETKDQLQELADQAYKVKQ